MTFKRTTMLPPLLAMIDQINNLALGIVQNQQTLTFQAEVLSGDQLTITASTDPTYFF